MAFVGSLQFSPILGVCRNPDRSKQFKCVPIRRNQNPVVNGLSSCSSRQDSLCCHQSVGIKPACSLPRRCNILRCHSFLFLGHNVTIPAMKTTTAALTKSFNALQGNPLVAKWVPAIGIIVFALCGLGPLMRISRNIFLHKTDSSWRKSTTNYVMASYLQPIILWTGAILICRALDPITMPTEASQLVKLRLLNFVKSLSTVLAFAYCLSSVIQQVQKYFMETNDPTNARNMGFQFVGKAVYTAVWVAAVSLFMELLGFSTQKWLTAGGLGTVLLTLAGREIFTNFLSSAMIHATRPFVLNEWIQTKIEGYEVSGTVEHVGWWSPTIIRGEDREAVHIPNHKFTMNVVRNLSQKTHWRVKTHLAISHLDVSKINHIVADMRKVLAKNPNVEQQKLHRRVFLDVVNPENQALMILISCFVKTSHHEEYLCVKEAILLDLLRVISHHRARLATPIRNIQKFYSDADLDSMSFSETVFSRGGPAPASKRPLLLIEPSYKIKGEEKPKSLSRSLRTNAEQDSPNTGQPTSDSKADSKTEGTSITPDLNTKEVLKTGNGVEGKLSEISNSESENENKTAISSKSNVKPDGKSTGKSSRPDSELQNIAAGSTDSIIKGSASTVHGKVLKDTEKIQPKGSVETLGSDEKASGLAAGSQVDNVEKLPPSEPSKFTPAALEENIVLGVVLEGSKRTLPIDEGLDSPATPADTKELAARGTGNGNSSTGKEENDK